MKKYTCKKYKNKEHFAAEKYCAPGAIQENDSCCKNGECNEIFNEPGQVVVNDNGKFIMYINGTPYAYTQTAIETCGDLYNQLIDKSSKKLGRVCMHKLMQSDTKMLCKDSIFIPPNYCGTIQKIPKEVPTIPPTNAPSTNASSSNIPTSAPTGQPPKSEIPLPILFAGGAGLLVFILLALLINKMSD